MNFEQMKALPPDEQEKLAEKLGKVRAKGKSTNYAAQYGSGVNTIARTAQVDLKTAKKLHAGYWKLNWSIKKIAERMVVKTLPDGSMWQKNPVNGFWYSLRTDKDKFSTLIQGLGSYILDIWLYNVFKIGKKRDLKVTLLGQFHDEIILEVPIGQEEEYRALVKDAIGCVNRQLKLNRDLDCDVQFGSNYSEIH